MILAILFGAAAVVLGLIFLMYRLESQGRRAAQNDQMRQTLDDIHTAEMVRDHLRHDPMARQRVRDRFTR